MPNSKCHVPTIYKLILLTLLIWLLGGCTTTASDTQQETPSPDPVLSAIETIDARTLNQTAEAVAAESTLSALETMITSAVETQVQATIQAALIEDEEISASPTPTTDAVAQAIEEIANAIIAGTGVGGEGGGEVVDLSATATPMQGQVAVNSAVNVRTGPGEIYDILGPLKPGDSAPVIARSQNDWYNIRYSVVSGAEYGWVKSEFLSVIPPGTPTLIPFSATLPPTPTSPPVYPTITPSPTPTFTPTPTATPLPTITPTSTAVPITVSVENGSFSPICRLVIHPSTQSSTENRLGLDPLLPNKTLSVLLTEGATVYDFKAWSCDNTIINQNLHQPVSNGYTWLITDTNTDE